MTTTVQKRGVGELLAFSNAEFDKEIKEMSLKDLLDTISTLQKEMSKEQENFTSLSVELSSLSKTSQQYKQISKETSASQTRLTALMDRSMKCFQQQGNQSTSTKFPNVQRRNSLKENVEQSNSKPVQRYQSARIPKKELEVNPPVIVNKNNAKSTPELVTSSNKPVFLKSLTDVKTSKMEVKKPSELPGSKSAVIKPTQTFQNGLPHNEDVKKQPVRTAATFNIQKSRSNEFLSNGPSKHGNGMIKSSGDSDSNAKQTTQFKVVLRKTNRSLIDNEEQENNFRHSVDLDLRESSKPTLTKPRQKSAENLSNINKVTAINVSSTKQGQVNGMISEKSDSKTNERLIQNVKLKPVEDNKPKVQTLTADAKIDKKSEEPKVQKIRTDAKVDKKPEEPQKKVVSSSVQFKPTTAVEARALAGGQRNNLLEEIQNFKRKPNPEGETSAEVKVQGGKNGTPDIVKSSIKKGKNKDLFMFSKGGVIV